MTRYKGVKRCDYCCFYTPIDKYSDGQMKHRFSSVVGDCSYLQREVSWLQSCGSFSLWDEEDTEFHKAVKLAFIRGKR